MSFWRYSPRPHRYLHRSGRPSVCLRCGTRMRRRTLTASPEYALRRSRRWSPLNPECPPYRGYKKRLLLIDRVRQEMGMGPL